MTKQELELSWLLGDQWPSDSSPADISNREVRLLVDEIKRLRGAVEPAAVPYDPAVMDGLAAARKHALRAEWDKVVEPSDQQSEHPKS